MFYYLQMQPKYVARLTRYVSLAQIDTLLQTVMFTLFGNQYDAIEERQLLQVFKVIISMIYIMM